MKAFIIGGGPHMYTHGLPLGESGRVLEVERAVELHVDRANPAQKQRNPESAGDPNLVMAAVAIVKARRMGRLASATTIDASRTGAS